MNTSNNFQTIFRDYLKTEVYYKEDVQIITDFESVQNFVSA